MRIDRTEPKVSKTLSVRTDETAYSAIYTLAEDFGTSPSVLLRLAICGLLHKAQSARVKTLPELITNVL